MQRHRTKHRPLAVLALVASLVSLQPALAAAQDPDPERQAQLDEAARLTFESAREAYAAGDYETALRRFQQAYELSGRPGLLYNIAQALDRLRRDEETVEYLRRYLREAPDARNRDEVEARIAVLDRAIAEQRAREAAAANNAQNVAASEADAGAGADTTPSGGAGSIPRSSSPPPGSPWWGAASPSPSGS